MDGQNRGEVTAKQTLFTFFFFFFLQQMHLQETKPASGCQEAQRAGGGAGRGSE